jgi:hypothetical protein
MKLNNTDFFSGIFFAATIFFLAFSAYADVRDTSKEEAICRDIGFKPKTQEFGDCVIELVSRGNNKQPTTKKNL